MSIWGQFHGGYTPSTSEDKRNLELEDERTQFMRNSKGRMGSTSKADEGQRGEFTEHRSAPGPMEDS